ncbi:MAG: DUF4491 family protein [Bacteroidales bacterium]|jgi:uncharacterized membrane protein|nr:DUF4491 family protein [Bacteroidales bacterium]
MFIKGILIGLASFIITGIFHPVVVKLEYYYGTKSWIWLCIPGIVLLIISFFMNTIVSILLGVLAFSLFWSCIEIFKQRTRVLLGRARKNPNRSYE